MEYVTTEIRFLLGTHMPLKMEKGIHGEDKGGLILTNQIMSDHFIIIKATTGI